MCIVIVFILYNNSKNNIIGKSVKSKFLTHTTMSRRMRLPNYLKNIISSKRLILGSGFSLHNAFYLE